MHDALDEVACRLLQKQVELLTEVRLHHTRADGAECHQEITHPFEAQQQDAFRRCAGPVASWRGRPERPRQQTEAPVGQADQPPLAPISDVQMGEHVPVGSA